MLIVNCIPDLQGWSPIQYMIALAAELMDARVHIMATRNPSNITKLWSTINGRSRNSRTHESCMLVCTGPGDLVRFLEIHDWRRRFEYLTAWIIDSFWLDHIPTTIRLSNPFDHLFVTSNEDIEQWKKLTRTDVTWVPWGTDALRLGTGAESREYDATRVGRQPPEWDDDLVTLNDAKSFGIKYRGRPAGDGLTALENHRYLMKVYSDSKYVIAFSNAVNPESYTHSGREYLTGRWVDALGCGAIVAGVAPRGPSTEELLWPGATLDFGSTRRNSGFAILAEALKLWSPNMAARNHTMALRKLDWRWRFRQIADAIGLNPAGLTAELALLQQRIANLESECGGIGDPASATR